jgi:thioredoxin reductase/NAD-dependent dihydropyrimidine dehydrogenase PreA subunit
MLHLLTASYEHMLEGCAAFVAVALTLYFSRRWLEDRRAKKKLAEAVKLELNVPNSLHPVIDPDICIGSGSCISACPEGKILGLVDGIATLVNASKCIGHGRCASECPVGAIKLVFGTAERGVELPEVDQFFETSREGVHIVGELAGMGLIKNALIQGLQVAARFKETIDRGLNTGGVDVAIVGAGPAGIATAVGCRAAGLSYALIEQDTVGGTVAHYPRQKLVMTETVDIPYYGKFGRKLIKKEDLVGSFQEVMAKAGVQVHEKTKVTAIDGAKDNFVVSTDRGIVGAKRVVLAIGRRGTPRKIGVPGEELDKVAYRLVDARQYLGKRVLVMGGGDSALEAAIQLADETDARVTICYRKPEFGRCRPLNKQKLDGHLKSGRIKAFMATEVLAVEREAVVLKNGTTQKIPNDFVIACLGGELPNEFLKSLGVSIRKHHGDKAMANPTLARKGGEKARAGRVANVLFTLVGVAVVAGLVAVGYKYYLLPRGLRYKSPDHAFLKPGGLWGHGVGVLATMFMLLNFIYPMRKRLPMFKGKGSIAPWLRFHVFVGIMSPLIILFHTAFQWGNQLATSTYVSVVVVVATGLVGRYFYGWVRLDPADATQADLIGQKLSSLAEKIPVEWRQYAETRDRPLQHIFALAANGPELPRSLPQLFLRMPGEALFVRRGLRSIRQLFLEKVAHRAFCESVHELRRLRTKFVFHRHFKRFMSVWRSLHVVLAVVLLALITMHVWVSLRVGFRWLWS